MIERDGVPSQAEIEACFPDRIVLKKPKAIIECYKEIPCNPCSTSCPFDAITVPEDINVRPEIDYDKCTGCGICVYNCPGLAITVRQLKDGKVKMKIPYEFSPLPEVGESLKVMNRAGERITDAIIKKVLNKDRQNKTALIEFEIEDAYLYDAMTIEVKHGR